MTILRRWRRWADQASGKDAAMQPVSDGGAGCCVVGEPVAEAATKARCVELVSRDGCHLCVEAERVVAEVCAAAGIGWCRLEVDADSALRARFGDHVPVVMIDGEVVDYWYVDAERLTAALRGEPVTPRPLL